MMKQAVDASKMNIWSWIMLFSLVIAGLALLPSYYLLGKSGLLIPGILLVFGIVAAIDLERL